MRQDITRVPPLKCVQKPFEKITVQPFPIPQNSITKGEVIMNIYETLHSDNDVFTLFTFKE